MVGIGIRASAADEEDDSVASQDSMLRDAGAAADIGGIHDLAQGGLIRAAVEDC